MGARKGLPQAPVFVGERVVDERYARFGKKIVEFDYRMSNGKVLPFLCAVNPGADPIIIFAVTDDGNVFLVNQFRHATKEFVLELPGGNLKSGHSWEDASWEDAAKAELLEELGVVASELKVIGERMPFNPAFETACFRAVLATGCKVIGDQDLDDTEVMTVRKIPIGKFREMLKNGTVTDAKTVAIGYLALDHLGLLLG